MDAVTQVRETFPSSRLVELPAPEVLSKFLAIIRRECGYMNADGRALVAFRTMGKVIDRFLDLGDEENAARGRWCFDEMERAWAAQVASERVAVARNASGGVFGTGYSAGPGGGAAPGYGAALASPAGATYPSPSTSSAVASAVAPVPVQAQPQAVEWVDVPGAYPMIGGA